MASDLNKNLDRARRSLEKNKLREAVSDYQAVLDESPSNQEALQALADIYTRLNEPALAARYYGAQFDRLLESGDTAKAIGHFHPIPPALSAASRPPDALRHSPAKAEPPLRGHRTIRRRLGTLPGATSRYRGPGLLRKHRAARSRKCRRATPCSENLPNTCGTADLAARSFLRAGQLTLAAGGLDEALEYFGRAHRLLPNDRTGALLFAEAKLRKGRRRRRLHAARSSFAQ